MVRIYGERVRTTRWWPWGPRSNWRSEENGASSTTTRRNQLQKSSDEERGGYTRGPEGDLAIKEGCCQTNRCKGFGHWAEGCTKKDVERARRSAPDRIGRQKGGNSWKGKGRGQVKKGQQHKPIYICREWNRDTSSCKGGCGLLHICSNSACRKTTDRHPASHYSHRSD